MNSVEVQGGAVVANVEDPRAVWPGDTDEISVRACRDLWAAVVYEALQLAFHPRRMDPVSEVSKARTWIGSRDFYTCCALAGIDGRAALERIQKTGVAPNEHKNACRNRKDRRGQA